ARPRRRPGPLPRLRPGPRAGLDRPPHRHRRALARPASSRMTGIPPDISADARTLMARLDELGRVSTDRERLNRQPYTAAHRQAIELVAGWMRAAGMETRVDAIGNLIG